MFSPEEDQDFVVDNQDRSSVDESIFQEVVREDKASLVERFSDGITLTPKTKSYERLKPTATIYPNGQMTFSRSFDLIIGKSRENPFGTHNHVSFTWGFDDEKENIVGYLEERMDGNYKNLPAENEYGPVGVLYLKFSETKQDFLSMKISSKWPKSVIGIKPVLDAVEEKVPKPNIPVIKREVGKEDDYLFYKPSKYDPDGEPISWDHYGYISWLPVEGRKYVFSGNSLEVDLDQKVCALYWTDSIITEVSSRKSTEQSSEEPATIEPAAADDIPF